MSKNSEICPDCGLPGGKHTLNCAQLRKIFGIKSKPKRKRKKKNK